MSKKAFEKEQKEKLDSFVINIEFLLISIVQGIALGVLASSSSEPLAKFDLMVIPYIISGCIFILSFWSQAIIHTLSFIDWPIDISHNFLYFLITFAEVVAFTHLTNPFLWFIFISLFFALTAALYFSDIVLIKKHKKKFQDSSERKILYKDIYQQEKFEALYFVPAGLIFNVLSASLIYFFPQLFLQKNYHIILIILQIFSGILFLRNSLKSFQKRSALITKAVFSQR